MARLLIQVPIPHRDFLFSGAGPGKNVALRPDFSVDKRVQRAQQLQHPNALNQRLPLPNKAAITRT
jgi:hypothetical protein